jgi:hypothetical protein
VKSREISLFGSILPFVEKVYRSIPNERKWREGIKHSPKFRSLHDFIFWGGGYLRFGLPAEASEPWGILDRGTIIKRIKWNPYSTTS